MKQSVRDRALQVSCLLLCQRKEHGDQLETTMTCARKETHAIAGVGSWRKPRNVGSRGPGSSTVGPLCVGLILLENGLLFKPQVGLENGPKKKLELGLTLGLQKD